MEAGADDAGEVHLYLTDYRSLYVTDIAEISANLDADRQGAVRAYYARRGPLTLAEAGVGN